jgi:hypothetical protein
MPEATAENRLHRLTAWRLLLAVLTLVMWARFLVLPTHVGPLNGDGAWQQSLGYFYHTDAQAGTDYVFTYGPLGYFTTWTYDPDCYWQRYLWELAVKLTAAVVVVAALAGLPSRGQVLFGALLVIVFVPFSPDAIYYVTLLAAGVLLLDGACRAWPRAAILVPLLALLAVTKFTFFLLALWVALLAELAIRLRGYRGWLSPAPLYLASVLAVWVGCGQRLATLGPFCRNSWEVARGYGEAMSLPHPGAAHELALAAAALVGPVLLLLTAAWRHRRSAFQVTAALLLAPGLFLAWKHGLTRADDHLFIFYGTALFVILLLPRLPGLAAPGLARWARAGLLLCCVLGLLLTTARLRNGLVAWSIRNTVMTVRVACDPLGTRSRLDQERKRVADEWRLPRVRAAVGYGTIDQLSCEQGALLLNGLGRGWRPRPVFQSYSAYTPALLRANADHFRSPAAPSYVLFSMVPADDRLGATEDSLALLEILRRYHPVFVENHFVLLKRVPAEDEVPAPEPGGDSRRTVRFGEEVSLPEGSGEYQVLALEFSPSARGLVRGFCYKRDPITIELRTASGQTLRRRVIPAMAEAGFLVNPLVDTTTDFLRLYEMGGGDRVVSFTVPPAGADFTDEIGVTVTGLARLPCRPPEAPVGNVPGSR